MDAGEKKLHHFEDSKEFREPQNRGEQYGAINYHIGENIAYTFINTPLENKTRKKYINRTYQDIAFDLVDAWVHSPPHYKNIINKHYQITGVSVSFDPETKRIYSTQKFAKIDFKYAFEENKDFFSYSTWKQEPIQNSFEGISKERHEEKHVWKLKTPKDSLNFCQSCNQSIDSSIYLSELFLKGNKIIFYTPDIEMMEKLIRKRKDGLAVEIVEYKNEDCGNPDYYTLPSRRNNQCIFSGDVLKPVYKKKLKRSFKPFKKYGFLKTRYDYSRSKKFEANLGRFDASKYEGLVEFNLLVIQKGKVCRIRRFSDVCGDSITELYPLPLLVDTFYNAYQIPDNIRTVKFEVTFEKDKSEFEQKDIQPILDTLFQTPFIIDSIKIIAFSSIEGDSVINLKLQEERGRSLAKAIGTYQTGNYSLTIKSSENWNLFYEQIKSDKYLTSWEKLSKSEIKERLKNQATSKRIENHLSQQRKDLVEMKTREIHPDSILERFIPYKFKLLEKDLYSDLRKNGQTGKTHAYIDTMQGLLDLAYSK